MNTATEVLEFTIPKSQWLSANMRLHWAAKSTRVAWLRALALKEGRDAPSYEVPVRIVAWIGYATRAKADPINASETGKPLMDGLVEAGVFIDDSDEWVSGPDYRRDPEFAPKGMHTVRLVIEPVENGPMEAGESGNTWDNKEVPRFSPEAPQALRHNQATGEPI